MSCPCLSDAIDLYLLALGSRHLSARHIETVKLRLSRLLRDTPDVPLKKITSSHLIRHFEKMEAAGLAAGTLAGQKSTVRAFLRWCKKRGWIRRNPAKVLKAGRFNYSFRPVHSRAAPDDHLRAVLTALPRFVAHRNRNPRDIRDALLVSLAADSAARRGELRNIRRVDAVRALAGQSPYRIATHGKTGPVVIRFFEDTAGLMRLWLEMMPDAPYLFVNLRTGARLRPDSMRIAFERLCSFADVPVFRFHAVRKRVVTDIIRATGDAKMGQMLAGHKDARTTQEYYNDIQQDHVDAAAAAIAGERRDDLAGDFFSKLR